MHTEKWTQKPVEKALDGMANCWECPLGMDTERGLNLTGQHAVHKILNDLISVLFPGCHGRDPLMKNDLKSCMKARLTNAALVLRDQVCHAFQYQCSVAHPRNCRKCRNCERKAVETVSEVISSLPSVQQILEKDIVAAYEGDPAARSTMEVVMSYPGVYAIIVHRIAHLFYKKEIPLIPRIMSEYAHSLTGIDIHPGAQIGPGFFIDHGTGVVIGETAVIGKRVKLYQGVTLGALSFEKDSKGRLIKGTKRHPNVGDHVVIYAGATILGGNTKIGDHSEIGGNVWLTHSVPAHSKVYNQQPKPLITQKLLKKQKKVEDWKVG